MKKLLSLLAVGIFVFVFPFSAFALVVNFDASIYSQVNGGGVGYDMGSKDIVTGDFNGDGKDDFAVDSGDSVHIVQGSKNDVADDKIGSVDRYKISTTSKYSVFYQRDAGDVNGDGYDDLLLYAYRYEDSMAYIFYGSKTLPTGSLSINDADIKISIGSGAWPILGDVDNNGKADLLLSNLYYDTDEDDDTPYLGLVYGFYNNTLNKASSTLSLSDADFTITGERPEGIHASFGRTMKVADIDNDGKRDLLISAHDFNETGREEVGKEEAYGEGIRMGAVYVIYGTNTSLSGDLQVADIYDARFTGDYEADYQLTCSTGDTECMEAPEYLKWAYVYDGLGTDIITGDLNGDNKKDLIFGSLNRWDFGEYTGALYIVYGNGKKLSGDQPIKTTYDAMVQPSTGNEAHAGEYGWTAVGDVNNDGSDDIVFNGFMNSGDRHICMFYGGKNQNALTGQIGADSADMIYKFNKDTFNSTLLDLDGDNKLDFIFSSGTYDTYKQNAGMLLIGYNNSELVGPRVTAGENGKIKIRDYDGNVTKKSVFNKKYSGIVTVLPHNNNYVVLHQKGRRLAVVDKEGNILANERISSVSWKYDNLQIFDLKTNDNDLEIIVTKKRASNNKVRTQTFRWNNSKTKIVKKTGHSITNASAKVSKTGVEKGNVIVRDEGREDLKSYSVTKKGVLK